MVIGNWKLSLILIIALWLSMTKIEIPIYSLADNTLVQLQVPPHSAEAEQSVIGSVLIDKDAIVKIADLLRKGDFYEEGNGTIYETMRELYEKRQPIDLLTLSEELKCKKKLKEVGGETYLAEIASAVPTATHIFEYARIVKQKAILRNLIKAGSEIVGLGYEEGRELNELLEKAEKSIFTITQTHIRNHFVHVKEVLQQRYDEFATLHDAEDKEKVHGLPTGYVGIDYVLNGLKGGDFVVIAARPSMGKTSLLLNIAQNIALKSGKTVGFFSFEMSKEQLVDRMFSALLQVDSWKLHKGQLDDADFARMGQVMDDLSRAKIFLDDSPGSGMVEVKSKARRLQLEHGLDLIVIDYLQLIPGNNPLNRVQEISEISRNLKELARELKVPVVAASQLSRAVENRPGKIPQLADLRESGAIEQDSDVVMMMYREDYYEEDSTRPGVTDIYIRKNRNGPTGRVELMFKKEQMRYYDIEKGRREEMVAVGDLEE